MTIRFWNYHTSVIFEVREDGDKKCIFITGIEFDCKKFVCYEAGLPVSHIMILGKSYDKCFNRYAHPGEKLYFVSINEREVSGKKQFIVEEENEDIRVKTTFMLENNNGVLSVQTEVVNESSGEITLECVAPLVLNGIMLDKKENDEKLVIKKQEQDVDHTAIFDNRKKMEYHTRPKFFKAHNTWCTEAVFEEFDLDREGMRGKEQTKRCGKIAVSSNGSQTTARYLPLGLFQKDNYGYLMFEILPEGSWSYEIEAETFMPNEHEIYLCLSGKTLADNAWYKVLKSGETYRSEEVRLIGAIDLDGIVEHTTKNRRNVKRKNRLNITELVIYNVFQQNYGPYPSAEKDEKWIPLVAETGSDYFVIDAGWFDNGSTHAIGVWDECQEKYPSGLIKSAKKTREKGMKFGLWLELQCVGVHCENKELLPEYCYFHINGVRSVCNGRYQLNYAYKEVRDYADGIIKKLVDRYDVDYIKIDYNQTQLGNEIVGGSYTEGLAEHMRAYIQWFKEIQDKYPNIIFETCASGGMMMDSNIGKQTTVYSVSDQAMYYNYPHMLANLSTLVLPEQAGIWCIPVGGWKEEECGTSDEQVIMNLINSFYGVMHLCSRIDRLTEKQKELLAEGIAYYKTLAKVKEKAIPIMPNGFVLYGDEIVCTGLRTDEKVYLSLYNLSNESKVAVQDVSKYGVGTAKLVYPKEADNAYELKNGKLQIELQPLTARSFELKIKK